MAIFSGKVVSAQFLDPPDNLLIEALYQEGDEVIPYVLEVDFTQQDFNDLLAEITLEEIQENTEDLLKVQSANLDKIIETEINRRWEKESEKIAKAYQDVDRYSEKAYAEVDRYAEEQKRKAYEEADQYAEQQISKAYEEADQYAEQQISKAYEEADQYAEAEKQKAYAEVDQYAEQQISKAYKEADQYAESEKQKAYQKAYEEADQYAEEQKSKKFEEVEEDFKKFRKSLQRKYSSAAAVKMDLTGKDLLEILESKNQDDNFIFNMKVGVLEDPIVAKSKDKKLKLSIRKSKSVWQVVKTYAEIKENS